MTLLIGRFMGVLGLALEWEGAEGGLSITTEIEDYRFGYSHDSLT